MNQPALQLQISAEFCNWLQQEAISLGFTTYQTNRLMLVGRNSNGRLAINERLFDKPMGLYAQGEQLYMSTRYQIWQFENHLMPGETYQEADRLYVPSLSYTTGSLNVHDLVLGRDGTPIFINTDFSCLATVQAGYSFAPIWQPPFITKLVAEDRCHLNGLAVVDGKPGYVTACSMTDSAAGWRNCRKEGGIVMHIPSNEVVVDGLSMPHSPRWYRGKLWLLNAGTGEFGYVDDHQFVPIAFCPGFVRGLTFWGDLAIVGLSKLRSASFSGLVLEERLLAEGKTAECGLVAIDLRSGKTVHSLFLGKPIEELFDVVVLPQVVRPVSLGFQGEDIERLVTFPSAHGLVTTKPTVKRSSGAKPPIAGLPTKERVARENEEAREYEAVERQLTESLTEATVKFQRVFHLNPESLAPYDAMTFPSLQQRWQVQPQRGEVIGVSASVSGDIVGFAIAELLPHFTAEIISLFVDPAHRKKGVATRMLAFLEREIRSQKFEQISLVYEPTALATQALTAIFCKLGWATPRSLSNGLKFSQKLLQARVKPVVNEAARLKFEEGKKQVNAQNLEEAIVCFQAAIVLQPDYIAAHNQMGNTLQRLGRSEEAISAYHAILDINPKVAAAHCNLGSIWQMQGKTEQAIDAYQRAIEIQPNFALAHRNLGGLFANQRRLIEAEQYLGQALQLQPQSAEIHQELGNVLRQIGRNEEAITYFRNAIKINSQLNEAYHNLGCLLMTKGQLEAAQKCFGKVLALQPDSPTVHTNLAFILEGQEQYAEALIAYDRSLALNPEATEILYQKEHLRLILCDWQDFDVRMQTLTERIQKHLGDSSSARLAPLTLNSFSVPIELHQAVNYHWSQSISKAMADLKVICAFSHERNHKHSHGKIRLGYLSPDFRSHPVGSLIANTFQYHDRTTFEVYAYSLTDTEDEITKVIQKGCDVFVNIAALSVEAGARRIYDDRIDILIDLAGYTTFSRSEILALQPAPIQIQYLGYPSTMAADFIQYILADSWLIPPELTPYYTETVLAMPHAFVTSPLPISDSIPSRSELGLPEEAFVYCCFNRTDKFDPHLFAIWMRILHQVPESVLWLSEVTPEITATLRKEALAQDIAPHRIVFSPKFPQLEFIAICQHADLFLDTFNYNAGATAICGLQSGLPVLTCLGQTFASRMAASICASVGLTDWICNNAVAYEEKAIYWGKHPQALRLIRASLLERKNNLPLFQPKLWIENLETLLKNLS